MSSARIAEALQRQFSGQRIVFWYDAASEFRAEFDALELSGVEKIALANNEFGVKYRVLREQPEQKFLLYHAGTQPDDLQNWLLDVQLASGHPFATDQAALWLAELGLSPTERVVLEEHTAFFEAASRRQALQALLEPGDAGRQIQRKMLAVCADCTSPQLDLILQSLLAELAEGGDKCWKLVERSQLQEFFWQQLQQAYGYCSGQASLLDFAITLFKSSFLQAVDAGHAPELNAESLIFLNRWKDSLSQAGAFEALSARCAAVLCISEQLEKLDQADLGSADSFELIDRKVLSDLVHAALARQATAAELSQRVRERRQSHWFERYRHEYAAVERAASLLQLLDGLSLEVESFASGVQRYANQWFRVDQLYRKFVYHLRESGQATLLGVLAEQVDRQYVGNFLVPLNERWQRQVDALTAWQGEGVLLQRDFARQKVQPYLDRKNKVCVLISDALRYEVGEELQSRIRQEDRFEAELQPMLAMLPSYTQLGMAALLPNEELGWADKGDGEVLVGGQSAQGSTNRQRILNSAVAAAAVVQARDLTAMDRDASRALVRDNDVLYVYHNLIDRVGDTRDTEGRVFSAAENTLEELARVLKKLFNANASHVLVTADHGFLYQDQQLQDSDFLSDVPAGDELLSMDRRFVLGRGLQAGPGFKHFRAEQLGLVGDMEVLIPKSIHRLRRKGSGSRFVHGGASLQEVVIPLLHVSKKRESDVTLVGVELIGGGGRVITTGQLGVLLYQREPVTEKVQPRTLRVGLYTLDGKPVSDQHELLFDHQSANAREREVQVRLLLSRDADAANNQQVELRLDEPVEGTSHHQLYKAERYTVRRSFTSEFDDF